MMIILDRTVHDFVIGFYAVFLIRRPSGNGTERRSSSSRPRPHHRHF